MSSIENVIFIVIFWDVIYCPGPLQNAFPVTASGFSSVRGRSSQLGTLWFLSCAATGGAGIWLSHCDQIFRRETLIRHDRRQDSTFRSLRKMIYRTSYSENLACDFYKI